MNITKSILTLFLSFVSIATFAANYSVKGVVVDSLGVGEAYATLRVYTATDSVKPVAMGVTDVDGKFQQTI